MDIVLLCAGFSSRMGKINKLLLPVNNTTLVANSAMQALKYLETLDESSTLIVVTGYRHFSTEKALRECKTFVEKTEAKINMVIVYNKDYREGQFTSVKTGVKQVSGNSPFFITLADLPKVEPRHYKSLESGLEGHDAVRPVCNDIPGHPVLLVPSMKGRILKAKKNSRVSTILKSCNVLTVNFTDSSYIDDLDTVEDLSLNPNLR